MRLRCLWHSGDGWFTLQIARVAARVTAIDIDPALLEGARHRLAESGAAKCEFAAGDAYDLSKLARRPADFVFIANAFHGVPDQPKLARAVGAALKPCGLLAAVSWHKRPREETTVLGEPRGPRSDLRMSPDETAVDVEAGGLGLVRVVEILSYHYGVVFTRTS